MSKLASSISYLAGARSRNICRTVSVQRVSEALNFGVQWEGLGSSNRSVHSSSDEDDSFSELGSPVTECAVSQLKLATEKPECFRRKNDSARKMLSHKFPPINKHDKKGTTSTCGRSHQNIGQPVDAFSAKTVNDTIRIQGIGQHASVHEIHSLCRTVGSLGRLAWVGKDAVDALFTVGSESDLQRILKKLNDTVIGDSHLSASLLSSNSTAFMSKTDNATHERRLQFSTSLNELRKQFELKKINLEDIEMMHRGIMHLQCPINYEL